MATQTKPQIFPEKEPFFIELKVGKELTKYRAWVGPHVVWGITSGPADKVKAVVARMARAEAEPIEDIKSLVASVADYVAAQSLTGITDITVKMGRYFHFGEKMVVMVRAQYLNRYFGGSWWAEVRVAFKGDDGLKALSRHMVMRFVEFEPPHIIDRDKLYNVLYEAARIAYNAYRRAEKHA
jgi:hypothetical protein